MGLIRLAKLIGPDVGAFMVCGLVGYYLGGLAPEGSTLALFISILLSYHLFLAWLILFSSGEYRDAGLSMPPLQTALTHLACLAVILVPVAVARQKMLHTATPQDFEVDMTRLAFTLFPTFRALCCAAGGLAVFERRWLFSSEKPVGRPTPVDLTVAPAVLISTADDFEAWRQHLAQQKSGVRMAGTSLKAEYERWLLVRRQSQAAQAESDAKAS